MFHFSGSIEIVIVGAEPDQEAEAAGADLALMIETEVVETRTKIRS
jgi:hypothetical protein